MIASERRRKTSAHDYDGVTYTRNGDGKLRNLPFYRAYRAMWERCYNPRKQAENPTYVGCSMHPDWHSLATFKEWFDIHYVEGWHLDKDLLVSGNKVYGPATCVYIPGWLNQLTTTGGNRTKASNLPMGVRPAKKRFQTKISIDGKQTHVGIFKTIEEAGEAFRNAKRDYILSKQGEIDSIDPRILPNLLSSI